MASHMDLQTMPCLRASLVHAGLARWQTKVGTLVKAVSSAMVLGMGAWVDLETVLPLCKSNHFAFLRPQLYQLMHVGLILLNRTGMDGYYADKVASSCGAGLQEAQLLRSLQG